MILRFSWPVHRLWFRRFSTDANELRTRGGRSVKRLGNTVSVLNDASTGKTAYLVGTAHVSQVSADEVRDLVRRVQPQVVMVELCRPRADRLFSANYSDQEEARSVVSNLIANNSTVNALSGPMGNMLLQGKAGLGSLFGGATNLLQKLGGSNLPPQMAEAMSKFGGQGGFGEKLQLALRFFRESGSGNQQPPWFATFLKALYDLLRLYGLTPGLEFKYAIEEARAIKARVVLGDRAGAETTRLLSSAITMGEMVEFGSRAHSLAKKRPLLKNLDKEIKGNIFSKEGFEKVIEMMKTREYAHELSALLREGLPNLHRILLQERDEILLQNLLQCPGKLVVAVVGLAHMEGIEDRWLSNKEGSGSPLEFY